MCVKEQACTRQATLDEVLKIRAGQQQRPVGRKKPHKNGKMTTVPFSAGVKETTALRTFFSTLCLSSSLSIGFVSLEMSICENNLEFA